MAILKSHISGPNTASDKHFPGFRSHRRSASLSLWKFSLPLITPKSRAQDPELGTIHDTSLPDQVAPNTIIDQSASFDISYFYINRTPSRDIPASTASPQRIENVAFNMHTNLSLVPLSFAQARTDISKRNEGFEMGRGVDRSPFDVRTQGLIPLGDALNREDIRRRGEGFELAEEETRHARRRGGVYGGVDGEPAAAKIAGDGSRPDGFHLSFAGGTGICRLSAALSDPSIYSTASGEDDSVVLRGAEPSRSWGSSADYSSPCRWTRPADIVVSDDGDELLDLGDLSSSFDEESFLRMAEPLGW